MEPHIRIITSDHIPIRKKRDKLKRRFKFFEDTLLEYPSEYEVNIMMTLQQWDLMIAFVDYLELPKDKKEWNHLLSCADYLGIHDNYYKLLCAEVSKFLNLDDFIAKHSLIKDPHPSLVDLAKKVQDIRYLTAWENDRLCHGEWEWHTRNGPRKRCLKPIDAGKVLCFYCQAHFKEWHTEGAVAEKKPPFVE